MYMHIYVNFYDLFLNVCTEKSLICIENVCQGQNSINRCDQWFIILSQYSTNTCCAPINKQLHVAEPRIGTTKIFFS